MDFDLDGSNVRQVHGVARGIEIWMKYNVTVIILPVFSSTSIAWAVDI